MKPLLSAVGSEIRGEVLDGLLAERKTLPAKLFYDDRGAWLFERICEQPEYYLTVTELGILEESAPDIARLAGPECAIVEYGSGAGIKIRILLDALEGPVSYTPVDISRRQLVGVAESLSRDYPRLVVQPVCADYTRRFALPRLPAHRRKLAFFPGSTIGNFHPVQAVSFLRQVRRLVGSDGALILGVDRHKDAAVLDAAYNDAAGVTAEFNLNVLARINRELEADFDLSRFRHSAFYNEPARRIEMHLVSCVDQVVNVAGMAVSFQRGETIWTESSYKYDDEMLESLAAAAGFRVGKLFTDRDEKFAVVYLAAGAAKEERPDRVPAG